MAGGSEQNSIVLACHRMIDANGCMLSVNSFVLINEYFSKSVQCNGLFSHSVPFHLSFELLEARNGFGF